MILKNQEELREKVEASENEKAIVKRKIDDEIKLRKKLNEEQSGFNLKLETEMKNMKSKAD